MNVLSLRYQPVEGGALGGHFALHVTLGPSNGAGVTLSPSALATHIHDAFTKLAIRSSVKGVLIDCRQSAETAEDMATLLGTLRDWQLHVTLWVGDLVRYPWFEYASWITVFVTHPKWPNFRANEIRYILPSAPVDWEEPEVYEVNAQSVCYLMFSKPMAQSTTSGNVIAFASGCRRPWGVIGWNAVVEFKLDE